MKACHRVANATLKSAIAWPAAGSMALPSRVEMGILQGASEAPAATDSEPKTPARDRNMRFRKNEPGLTSITS